LAFDDDVLAVHGFERGVAHGWAVVTPQPQPLAAGRDQKGLVLPGALRIGAVGSDLDPAFQFHSLSLRPPAVSG